MNFLFVANPARILLFQKKKWKDKFIIVNHIFVLNIFIEILFYFSSSKTYFFLCFFAGRLVEANNSPLFKSDIPTKNGVIHVVDWILRPSDLQWCEGTILPWKLYLFKRANMPLHSCSKKTLRLDTVNEDWRLRIQNPVF